MARPEMPLFVMIGEHIGPLGRELLAAWEAAGVGGACARCDTVLVEGWVGAECPTCYRAYQEAHGCKCGGTGLCPDCAAAGATPETRSPKCEPNCSTLCPVCDPDD